MGDVIHLKNVISDWDNFEELNIMQCMITTFNLIDCNFDDVSHGFYIYIFLSNVFTGYEPHLTILPKNFVFVRKYCQDHSLNRLIIQIILQNVLFKMDYLHIVWFSRVLSTRIRCCVYAKFFLPSPFFFLGKYSTFKINVSIKFSRFSTNESNTLFQYIDIYT